MAARSTWFERLRDIIATLEKLEGFTQLDRDAFEKLFKLKRRRALVLMKRFGAKELGVGFVIERETLLGHLRKLRKSRSFAAFELEEEDKAARVAEAIEEAQRTLPARQREIRLARPHRTYDSLAAIDPAIQIGAKELRLQYTSSDDFLRQFAQIAGVIMYDLPSIEDLMGREVQVVQPVADDKPAIVEFEICTEDKPLPDGALTSDGIDARKKRKEWEAVRDTPPAEQQRANREALFSAISGLTSR
jgi:hypothetical protein